ncbi:MAG: hypothetical protein FWH17_11090 [Oscillospiraceae bacterium]|nr:hypothetical protein [Oscillospiraceae bacterium]
MERIYVVIANGEAYSAHKEVMSASSQVAELCKLEFDNVQYDACGFAQSESGAVRMCAVYLQE